MAIRSKQQSETSVSQLIISDSSQNQSSVRITEVLRRQRWVILGMACLGVSLASWYWTKATVWFESRSKVLVSQRDPGITSTTGSATADTVVNEDVLANHMVIVRSRRIIEEALKSHQLDSLPSIQAQIKDRAIDATGYVIEHLKLTRGGEGTARDARILTISFEHTDPDDARLVLEAVILEYQKFLSGQLSRAMSDANSIVKDARNSLEEELDSIQDEYIKARQNAPVLFQGDGSSNVYLEQYRRLHEELLTLDIQESGLKERLEKARSLIGSKKEGEQVTIEDLGVIDTESLTRLGAFAGLQANSAKSAEFQASQPERLEEARTSYSHLLKLMSEKRRLEADFGPGHPDVRKLEEEIKLVQSFVDERAEKLSPGWDESQLSPGTLLKAYVAFLESDQTSIEDRRRELKLLIADAEKQSRVLVEFELKEGILRSRLERTQALFDGLVEQLRGLDLASGMQGYIHELLEAPRPGSQVWPSLPLCGAGGLILGLMAGLVLALVNDQLDHRFRSSSEIDSAIGLPILARIGRLKLDGKSPIVHDKTPESESFRLVRTLMLNDIRDGKLRVLTATSPVPGDGKTTILANVAAAFAKLNMSVLLIEADIRRPTFHKRFRVPDDVGLSEVLKGLAPVESAIIPSGVPNLSLITAGRGAGNPAELLQNATFDQLIEHVKAQFELVIIDVGPVLAVSDSVIVGQKSDGMMLVVRSSNNTRQQVMDAIETLRSAGINMLGCVLNTYGSGNEFEKKGYYGHYYSDRTRSESTESLQPTAAGARLMTIAEGRESTEDVRDSV
ncbi:MAG: polysaccharide biosynthesis tyrosine autokinase [Planctomycetaceae bacterium]|nr:polysaccharide biosynthesis tyrosine autokinase [Planctomycetaceae bacterium]